MTDAENADFGAHAKRRAWFVALQAVLVLCGVVLVLGVRDQTTYSRTTHFVLHPDSSVPPADVPQAIDVLNGSLVQTVLRVLNSGELLDQSATAARVTSTAGISLDATLQPGSAYFDATVRGDDRADVDAVSRAFSGVASQYVDRTYSGYDLEMLGASAATERAFPPSPAIATLSVLLGALLGIGLVYVEWIAHRPRFTAAIRRATATGQPSAAVMAVDTDARSEQTTRARGTRAPAKKRATAATPKRSTARAGAGAKSEADGADSDSVEPKPAASRSRKPRSTSTRPKKTAAAAPGAESTSTQAPADEETSVAAPLVEAVNEKSVSGDDSAGSEGRDAVEPPTPAEHRGNGRGNGHQPDTLPSDIGTPTESASERPAP